MPEHVLWMQSGHAQDKAARQYVGLNATNPDLLFRTFRAFNLSLVAAAADGGDCLGTPGSLRTGVYWLGS